MTPKTDRRFSNAVIVAFICLAALTACDSDESSQPKLAESEASEIQTILTTGAEHPDDPYVRAETFRVLEILADEEFGKMAEKGVADGDPMVRVAALRALLASGHPRGRAIALDAFRKRSGQEQESILRAALDHGNPPLKREIVGRALRTDDPKLRYFAFTSGLLARVQAAADAGDEERLRRHLLPELGTHVKLDDPVLAALALEKFVDVGEEDRARPIIETFENGRAPLAERVSAGGILARAHVASAKPAFQKVVDRWEDSMRDDRLGIPQEVVQQQLLRVALLGLIATGDTKYVERAQRYTKNATNAEMLEVLEALSRNPSEDAAVSLKIAMQDARDDVRSFAVERYKDREDASPRALYDVLPAAPYSTQRQVAVVLWTNFPDDWIALNEEALQRSSEVDGALTLLRNVVNSPDEVEHIAPLKPVLQKVAEDEKRERANLARYLLRLIAESNDEVTDAAVALDDLDRETTYSYLEFLVRSKSGKPDIYRRYFYSDNFALRLMSAAGLWKVSGGAPAGADTTSDGETAAGDADEGEAEE